MAKSPYERIRELLATQREGVYRSQDIVDEEELLMRQIAISSEVSVAGGDGANEVNEIHSLTPQFSLSEVLPVASLSLSEQDAKLAAEAIDEMNAFRLS